MFFCKHDYKLISETTTQSKLEHAIVLNNVRGRVSGSGNPTILERKHIQVFTCSKCGNLKRFVENI